MVVLVCGSFVSSWLCCEVQDLFDLHGGLYIEEAFEQVCYGGVRMQHQYCVSLWLCQRHSNRSL